MKVVQEITYFVFENSFLFFPRKSYRLW